MLLYWIWLTLEKYISPRAMSALLKQFGDPEAIFRAEETALRTVEELKDKEVLALCEKDLRPAQSVLTTCDNLGIRVLTWQDAAYPDRLRNIFDPPYVLYYEGKLPSFDNEPSISLVGTRKASAYGLMTAKRLGYQLGRAGMLVVSGAARGIDSLSLEGALTAGRPVVAVLGCGTDVVYPAENKSLLADIRSYGCLISEYPPGTVPKAEHFPKRNRIMSALSLGVIVVEAPLRSGALITARHALEQGKDVFTVPGNIGTESLAGNIALMKEGAIVIENGADVVREYLIRYPRLRGEMVPSDFEIAEARLPHNETVPPKKLKSDELFEAREAHKRKVSKPPEYLDIKNIITRLTETQASIVLALKDGPLHIDEVIKQTGCNASAILGAVTMLEIRGYIKRLPGQIFVLPGHGESEEKE